MIKLIIPKPIFHNSNLINKNSEKQALYSNNSLKKNINVDINKLLNRVKLNQKNEIKSKIIYFSSAIFLLSFVGFFITIIK